MITIGLIMACVLLVIAVLMQKSKGGLQSQTVKSIVGVKKGTPLIERATWTLALLVMLFAMFN